MSSAMTAPVPNRNGSSADSNSYLDHHSSNNHSHIHPNPFQQYARILYEHTRRQMDVSFQPSPDGQSNSAVSPTSPPPPSSGIA